MLTISLQQISGIFQKPRIEVVKLFQWNVELHLAIVIMKLLIKLTVLVTVWTAQLWKQNKNHKKKSRNKFF